MGRSSNLAELTEGAAQCGLVLSEWAPGDGVRRYRFARADDKGRPCRPLATLYGSAAAEIWLSGYAACYHDRQGV